MNNNKNYDSYRPGQKKNTKKNPKNNNRKHLLDPYYMSSFVDFNILTQV